MDQVKQVYESLFKTTRQLILADTYGILDFIQELPVQQSILQAVGKLNEKINPGHSFKNSEDQIKTVYHACAKAASESTRFIYKDEKFGTSH